MFIPAEEEVERRSRREVCHGLLPGFRLPRSLVETGALAVLSVEATFNRSAWKALMVVAKV